MADSTFQPTRSFGGHPDRSIITDLIRAIEHAERVVTRRLLAAGAPTLRDLGVLDELGRAGRAGLRTTQLAERVGISTSRLAHQLKGLEARGLAARRRHEADRRGVVVTLTKEGRATLEKGNQILENLTVNRLAALSGEIPTQVLVVAHSILIGG